MGEKALWVGGRVDGEISSLIEKPIFLTMLLWQNKFLMITEIFKILSQYN